MTRPFERSIFVILVLWLAGWAVVSTIPHEHASLEQVLASVPR